MRAGPALTVFAVLAGGLFGQATRPAEPGARASPSHNQEDVLAADSFRRSAVAMTCSASAAPARANRLVVLTRFADRLVPGEWRTSRLLADIHLAQADPNAEARALAAYLKAFPGDHARYLRWVTVRLGAMQTAEERAGFLQSIVDRKDVSRPIRAEVAAMLAELRNGQGRTPDAVAAARRAVELDPYGPNELAVWAVLEGPSTPAARLDLRLRVLRGDPRAAAEAWEVALQLGKLGLHADAVGFLNHAWPNADPAKVPPGNVSERQLLVDYCNALLDAGRPEEAVKVLVPAVRRHSRAPELRALLHEAYRATGKEEEAKKLLDTMAKSYKDREAGGEASAGFAAEIAWFYVYSLPEYRSVIYAKRAMEADPNNLVYQRILGAAEMGHTEQARGEGRLRKLLGKDAFASVFLAEWYNRGSDANSAAKCKEAVLAAVPLSRSGPAYRRLSALANKRGIGLPEAEGAQEAKRLIDAFDQSHLQMLREPEKFVAVDLKPARPGVYCGEPVEVVATLRNIGSLSIPLGRTGLLRPELALSVKVVGSDGATIGTVSGLPMVLWPAPRYLEAGEGLDQKVRLDVAELGTTLALRPLEDLSLEVTGTLDPSGETGSSLPSVKVPAARIVRMGLLGKFDSNNPDEWPKAYGLALGRIVRDLRRGTLAERMRAARQTGALLAMAWQIKSGRAEAPRPLAGKIDTLVMLAIMRAILADRSPAVRQEMIASLHHANLDTTAMSLLAPAIEDPSPMVRCRLVELLGASASKGHETIARHLAGDKDDLVRDMARAFVP